MPPSLQCPHYPLPSPHTPYTYHPHSFLHCPQYLLVVVLLLPLHLLLLSNCFPLLQVLLHNALGAGLFCSTCGLLPTFSLAMASPLLVKKTTLGWLASRPQTPNPPPLNVIMMLTVGKMICESPLMWFSTFGTSLA